MKLCKRVLISALTCFGAPSIVAIKEQTRNLRSMHTIFSEERFECVLFTIHGLPINPSDHGVHRLTCMADDHLSYRVNNVPDNFFEDTPLISGVTRISLLTSAVSRANFTVSVADGNGEIIANEVADLGRYTNNEKSVRSIIVVRVFDSNNNNGPTASKEYLSTKVFGTGGTDMYNLVSGYDICSGGMTTFTPGSYATSNNGVMDLILEQPINLSTDTAYDIEFMANLALGNLPNWDWNANDHVMYVLSDTVNFLGAAAFAYLPGSISVFDEAYAATYLVLMHELGHNLGMHHSGLGTDPINDQYRDPTCWMGAHIYQDEGPPSCFNGAKSWDFGWYSSNSVEIDPQVDNANLNLIGINDYLNGEVSSVHTTVVKIIGDSETLYMLYNKKEGINSGTAGYGDDVTIVHQPGARQISWFRAGLDAGQKYEATNFRDGKKLVVEVCEKLPGAPDIARTIVYLDTVNDISCDASNTSPPTNSPQASPTASPQSSPSKTPSASPQALPSKAPQATPTQSPQAAPTNSPQASPTASPQTPPSKAPSASPQASPSQSPRTTPTQSPQASPTTFPTTTPSLSPQASPTTCTEDERNVFLLSKKKKGRVRTQTCKWLSELNQKKRGRICLKNTIMTSEFSAAENICRVSCNSCDPCYENGNSRFLWKFKRGRAQIKTCHWLGTRSPSIITEICTDSIGEYDGYGAPADVCPQTCSSCNL